MRNRIRRGMLFQSWLLLGICLIMGIGDAVAIGYQEEFTLSTRDTGDKYHGIRFEPELYDDISGTIKISGTNPEMEFCLVTEEGYLELTTVKDGSPSRYERIWVYDEEKSFDIIIRQEGVLYFLFENEGDSQIDVVFTWDDGIVAPETLSATIALGIIGLLVIVYSMGTFLGWEKSIFK